ncbi:MAG: bifunctional riboflavin kinase/FAD synthetase [Clostridiales bacterium]|nr:bifunctional riboflavin kinase/FAD synthetase [Clostridiales bacterium]MDD7035452.1 bifunctional riboflavin kinase/FAD synthetase [Bacillota bacterium]MDY2919965.1 bifunctional riboflavin kinase/FAD synthetase [Lentihominibacter sp.]
MKIFNSLDEINNIEPTVVALGNFDGVHRGHQQIIGRTVKEAEAAGIRSGVFTFSNHTSTVLDNVPAVKNILYADEKAAILESMGVDYMFNIPFDRNILTMSPERFIEEILVDKFNIREAYCGFNYRFGFKGAGTPEVLMREGLKRGFGIHVQEPYEIDGIVVSSTYIRQLIEEGRMEECTRFMGRMYTIGGEVVVGNKLGRTIGFPTSNLIIDESMVTPPNGVYITLCTYNGVRYPSVTNVGVKPTIGTYNKNVETHIFNFDKELYGKEIRVEFIRRTRPEKKFSDVEELSAQIRSDCISAKAYHRERGML